MLDTIQEMLHLVTFGLVPEPKQQTRHDDTYYTPPKQSFESELKYCNDALDELRAAVDKMLSIK